MSYPRVVYHKSYDSQAPEQEKHLNTYSKTVKSVEELKSLGSEWGDHPNDKAVKKEVLSEEQVSEVLEDVVEAPKKGKKAKV